MEVAKSNKAFKKSQIRWTKSRYKECASFENKNSLNACIARETRARIRYLEYLGAVLESK